MTVSLSDLPRMATLWAALDAAPDQPFWPYEFLRRVFIVAVCLGAALLLRGLIGNAGADGAPYATLYPAIGVAALFAGFWAGVATLLLGWTAAWFFFVGGPGFDTLERPEIVSAALFFFSAIVLLLTAVWLRDTIMRLEHSAARYRALIEASTNVVASARGEGDWCVREPGWEALTGMNWPDYRDQGWLSAVHEDDRAELKGALRASGNGLASAQARIWNEKENEWRWFGIRTVVISGPRGFDDRIITFADIHERKLAREREELMSGDLRHRLKNLFAVIQALLTSSLPKDDKAAATVAEKFMARLRAIQNAGDLIMSANWHDVEMSAIVKIVLAPFMDANKDRFTVDGPPLLLHEHTAGGIALACHELATNAIKYGALSSEGGSVSISWSVKPEGADDVIEWLWRERGGPTVSELTSQGFGIRVIRSAIVRERENAVDVEFRPEGLVCRMKFLRARAAAGPKVGDPLPAVMRASDPVN